MKKLLLITVGFLFTNQIFPAMQANMVSLTLGRGGLQTPDKDVDIRNFSFYSTSHKAGGIVYRFSLIHFLPKHLMRLPFGLRVGVEGGYTKNADNTYNRTSTFEDQFTYTYKSSALSILSVAQYTFNSNWLLSGKLGVARVVQTLKYSKLHSATKTTTKNHFSPEIVLAGGYSFNKHFQLLASYDYILGQEPSLGSNSDIAPITFFGGTLNILF